VEQRGGDDQHGEVDEPGHAHGDDHVPALEPQHLALLGVVAQRDPALGQGGVQVDDVGHDGGTDNAHRQQRGAGAGQGGHETTGDPRGAGADLGEVVEETEGHDEQQRDDRQLELAMPPLLQGQDPEGNDGGDQPRRQRGHLEQQVQPDRRANELGQVGGDGNDLGLRPQPDRPSPTQVVPGELGKVAAGGHAQLRREVLHEHRHQVGQHDHPDQRVAEPGARFEVGGEVARVDVGHRGDERRPQQREDSADPPPPAEAAQRALLFGQRAGRAPYSHRLSAAAAPR
jgi:hypothetical protein